MRTRIIRILLPLMAATLAATAAPLNIIPLPEKADSREGTFELGPQTKIVTDDTARETGQYLAARLRKATGYACDTVTGATAAPGKGVIILATRDAKTGLGAEGYELTVTPESVVIRAPASSGLFYGVQTLLQLLPPEIYGSKVVSKPAWVVPCASIEDRPRFGWRGFMLDVSRHFFNKAEVKEMLDAMALHKLNSFHWHLVDDHGWRIQIKKYPKLTEVGAWRSGVGFNLDPKSTTAYGPDGRYGGFYTQDDIREILAYAAARHITIVPEIEMPGHSSAALAAYPQFSCSGKPYSTDVQAGVHAGVYCAGNDEVFGFLQDILSEVTDLFPSKYIHIGGDEVPKDNWKKCEKCQARMKAQGLKTEHELQSYFIKRIEKIINAKGRNLLGWSEIREGGLAQNAAVMDWIGGAVEAATGGHDVVMSPTGFCYFDYYQSQDKAAEPRAIGGFIPLSKVYSFEPIPAKLDEKFQSHILGAQGNLWTEYIASFQHVQYMAFPRLSALSEVTWSPKGPRNFEDFKRRLVVHQQRLDQMGVNYRKETSVRIGGWTPKQVNTSGVSLEWDVTSYLNQPGKYKVTFNYTRGEHGLRLDAASMLADGKEIFIDNHAGFAGGKPAETAYTLEVPEVKAGVRYAVRLQTASDGGNDSFGDVFLSLKPAPLKP